METASSYPLGCNWEAGKLTYRAKAIGIDDGNGHSLEIYGSSRRPVEDWAKNVSDSRKCSVEVYVTEERLILTVDPEPPGSAQNGKL